MIFEEFTARQEHKELFRKLTENIRGEHGYLLICIDELDRCRPTFAIETLEVVKHFFDLPNVIFVFSLDMEQLHRSIKTVYGDIDSMGYLQRFFDYQTSLPKPNLQRFLEERFVDSEGNSLEVHAPLFLCLAERFSLSLRVLEVICKEYAHFLERKKNVTGIPLHKIPQKYKQAYLALFCMKYADPFFYLDFLQKGTGILDQNDRLWVDLFGWQGSPVDEYQSCYTAEIAALPLSALSDEAGTGNNVQHARELFILWDGDFKGCGSGDFLNTLTLSRAIRNNVEYGCLFPTDAQLNPKK